MTIRRPYHRRPLTVLLAITALILTFWVSSQRWALDGLRSVDNPNESQSHPPRVAKVSMLYGKPNPLYERAVQSHQRHAQRWGYPMHVLREDISVGFWNKPSYLLSLVIQELTKPVSQRVEWLMWVDADSIIINPAIPLEIFLPPASLAETIHLIATQDQNGLNTGIMFLHVHAWTIGFLVETLAYPRYRTDEDLGRSADQEAMARVLRNRESKGDDKATVYLPRPWINTYEWHHAYEGHVGNLLVHFPGLEEDRWAHMARWLEIVEGRSGQQVWEVPLAETAYGNDTEAFWGEIQEAQGAQQQVAQ